jgi:hypothetical protein
MRGEYRGQRGVRPRDVCRSDRGDGAPARLFVCMGCRSQALICSCCDRGQIYCAGDCADRARHHAQRAAGRRYQSSRRGRLAHAVRARRYRARGKKVTHQGSPLRATEHAKEGADDLLASGSQGRWCTLLVQGEMIPIQSGYAMTGWRRTESGRPAANIRFSTATPMAASVCWAAKPRARSRGPINVL